MTGCCTSKKTPAPDDACPCGSGKKFKDCCGKK
ncbi:MAG: SEC-C metal-binding domain-containing protein [Methanolobus sp.]|nr:SEC-C metal-binding domain-containing protein [Methanolobus sp.]